MNNDLQSVLRKYKDDFCFPKYQENLRLRPRKYRDGEHCLYWNILSYGVVVAELSLRTDNVYVYPQYAKYSVTTSKHINYAVSALSLILQRNITKYILSGVQYYHLVESPILEADLVVYDAATLP